MAADAKQQVSMNDAGRRNILMAKQKVRATRHNGVKEKMVFLRRDTMTDHLMLILLNILIQVEVS